MSRLAEQPEMARSSDFARHWLPGSGDTAERVELLSELRLFQGIAREELLPLALSSDTLRFEMGEYLVRQGEAGDSIYLIVEGRVEVLARVSRDGIVTETAVASLVEGDAVGELSVLDGQPRSASCVAAVPTRCVRLRRNVLRDAMRQHWPLAEALLTTLAERLRHADAVMAEHARDPLTGVYNRRALYELYDRETRRAQRAARRAAGTSHEEIVAAQASMTSEEQLRKEQELEKKLLDQGFTPLALLFIDVNKFKTINDTYGHKTGDDVLCAVAQSLTLCGRATDHVARYGGDEFVVILPDGGLDGAELVSSRVRDLLADNPPGPVPFSISIGAAVVNPLHPQTLDEVMAEADELMYQDKARQR
ncbi:MAG TPA: GGDEF domain-containing protein [Chloroflexota bacterium]|nr:GGDEF domain-containing protein [Chloroflexota bacterium]